MNTEIVVLCGVAASIGFLHTLFGPDHYLPFIVMSRARKWSMPKTAWITFLCGVGHVLSSVVLGLLGVALGIAVMNLEAFEPLIPILMYPAAKSSVMGMLLVATVFAVTTIGTMMSVVMLTSWGVSFARFGRFERYMHATAGAMICLSGMAIQFLGL